MKTIRIVSITLIMLLGTLSAKSQIYFHNNYTKPVIVVLGYYLNTDAFQGWVTEGWYTVDPGETTKLLDWLPLNHPICYYAQTKDGVKKFDGDASFLVDPTNAFIIKNADMQYVKDDNATYQWYKFRQVHFTALLSYTVEFNY